ncbi:MAG: hypothetical protein ABIO14_09710 [Aeromicrobium sp.]
MHTPWTKGQITLEKVEEQVVDWIDKLDLEQHLTDLKDQIAASDTVDTLRDKIPGVKPAKKSHKRRNVALLAVAGAGAAVLAIRHKATTSTAVPAPFTPTPPVTVPSPN